MDTKQLKQIAIEQLANNADITLVNVKQVWGSEYGNSVGITLSHPEMTRFTVTLEASYEREGSYYDDSEGNLRCKKTLKLTTNWAAYGSVNLDCTAAQIILLQEAQRLLGALKNVLPTEIEEVAETVEERAQKAVKRAQAAANQAALAYVGERKLIANMRVGTAKMVHETGLADAQVTFDNRGKDYAVTVRDGTLTVARGR